MSRYAVARNYADALYALAEREDAQEEWLTMLGEIGSLYRESPPFRAFLNTPRVAMEEKKRVLRSVLGDRYPEPFIRFLQVVLDKRRQGLIPLMEDAYREILNERTGRVHASVTLPFEADEVFRGELEAALSRFLEGEVAADFRTDREIIGGLVVRVKDRVLDGSVRRRLQLMRRALLDENAAAVAASDSGSPE
ncbi:MAG: ATP synthase F1 subunit delta [marine benthic group bacterium]|nr:ATP synthase F1 subunit delta [Gemmatimonadota bacterium]MCL7962400.1 ATP synthase F1 subunit delta [Candidatus Carthagonibacter metallireducens]MCL7957394.1 ATP synthase F1 subunit delta [Gemmatimonadota bacterium]MCL7966527.1 ATP synthase F1 subunit delta [Gemmatimonadota bacterium]MCL7969009.1 ATP synthase F1 subunit delta [Gemmatimonadota bacterium]